MAIYKRDIVDINLESGNIHRTFLAHTIGYKDQKADHFGVRVFRDGEAVSLTGVSVQGVFMPPQGSPIAITSGNIVSGNTAEVVLPQACYDYNGQFCLAIKLVDSSNSVTGTVRIVDGVVDNTHASGTVAPTSAVPTYQEVLSAYEQAIAVIGSSVRFDTTQSLTTAQKTTARGNIDAASTDDVSDLKSALSEYDGTANLIYTEGKFWENLNGSLHLSNYSKVAAFNKVRCRKGDTFRLSTTGIGTALTYFIADSSDAVLASGSATVFDGTVEITQDNAYWIAINSVKTKLSDFVFYQSNINSQKQININIDSLDTKIDLYIIPSSNLVDLSKLQSNSGYFSDTGVYTDSENYSYYNIPVEPSTQYSISCFTHFLTFWDYTDTFVDYIGSSGTRSTDTTFTTPANARSMKVVFNNVNDAAYIPVFMLVKGTTIPTDFVKPNPSLSEYIILPGYSDIKNNSSIHYGSLFDPEFQLIVTGQINDTDGEFVETASANRCADPLYYPLENGAKYIFNTTGISYNVYYYDENKTFITSAVANNAMMNTRYIFTNSNNYKYFRVAGYKSGGTANYLHSLHAVMNYIPRKVVCLGDSMTAGNGTTIAYHMYLAEKTGWTCLNWGVGGSGWAFDMTASTTVGKGVEGLAPSGVTPDYNTDFAHAVSEIPTDADLYIVFGGYNDWNTDQTESAFRTAVETVLTYIQQNIPTSRILTITPPQRYKSGGKDGRDQNEAGLTVKDYGSIIKEISELHAVQCIDLYTQSGLYPYSPANNTENYASDGVHPNANGHKRIYETIVDKAIALLSMK